MLGNKSRGRTVEERGGGRGETRSDLEKLRWDLVCTKSDLVFSKYRLDFSGCAG